MVSLGDLPEAGRDESGGVFSAPPHCPVCDYAPATWERVCSECGLDFEGKA